ncbi:hypothetical protein DFH27DRAFT_618295 [Peziza echinospora]|nr:hypothetical protein DFH27DRAFT_618295 [Peziza echinospora]
MAAQFSGAERLRQAPVPLLNGHQAQGNGAAFLLLESDIYRVRSHGKATHSPKSALVAPPPPLLHLHRPAPPSPAPSPQYTARIPRRPQRARENAREECYKRDTSRLIYWLIHSAKTVCEATPAARPAEVSAPELSLANILALSKLIAQSTAVSVPDTIYGLFESVISARSAANSFFQNIAAKQPDREIAESNSRHKAFIDTLAEAFNALGGEAWRQRAKDASASEGEDDDVAFMNKYASLSLGTTGAAAGSGGEEEEDDDDDGDGDGPELKENVAPAHRHSKKGKKGKKGKGKKKGGRSVHKAPPPPEPTFEDIPLESYKIIDEKSTVTDYLLAVHSIIQELVDLRLYTQGIWQRVCQGTLNSAAAGAMCNIAVATVKQLQFEIGSDFPGNGSFDAILNTITRGDPEAAQGQFQMGLWDFCPDGTMKETRKTNVDVKECFMAYAYWDLVAFIEDFRKNRTGHPTKAMLAKLNWDPNLDLKTASRKKRNEWRSAYTINWLYDIVLVWSSIVLQRKNGLTTGKPQHFVLENEDWSAEGKWGDHRRLYGPLEFVGEITALAMSKETTDIKSRILPHHVFQMQCMVDSFVVSRGWSYYPLKGHVCTSPAKNYDPLLDIKHFLDRPNRGINYSIDMLLTVFNHEATTHPDLDSRFKRHAEILPLVKEDLNVWLGSSKLAYGLKTLPASRFSNTNTNGMWVYSPYLCGTGLAEALEFIYNYGMVLWDRNPEPAAMLHLYNLLMKTGNMPQPIEIMDQCIDFFGETVFHHGKVPTNKFLQAWKEACGHMEVLGWDVRRKTPYKSAIGRTTTNPKDVLGSAPKRLFKQRSLLALLKGTKWRPEKISPADLPKFSLLNFLEYCAEETARRRKLQSRKTQPTPSSTTMPAKPTAGGQPPSPLSGGKTLLSSLLEAKAVEPRKAPSLSPEAAAQMKKMMDVPADYSVGTMRGASNIYNNDAPTDLSNRAYLEVIERDIVNDIYGNVRPLSAISYFHLLACLKMIFMTIALEGQHIKQIRDANSGEFREPVVTIVTWALRDMDAQLLAFMGQVIAHSAGGLGGGEFSYFPNFVDVFNMNKRKTRDRYAPLEYDPGSAQQDEKCLVM